MPTLIQVFGNTCEVRLYVAVFVDDRLGSFAIFITREKPATLGAGKARAEYSLPRVGSPQYQKLILK